MNADDPIVLYIVLRQSLQLDNDKVACCAADVVQHLLMKYFALQLWSVKTKKSSSIYEEHVKLTTKWLSIDSQKTIVSVDDAVWDKLKDEFSVGKDLFCLKNPKLQDIETALYFWPCKYSCVPQYLKELK